MRLTLLILALTVTFATSHAATPTPATSEEQFKTECSACHLAYPAGFLPKRSWEAVTANLAEHFGEDASLSPEVTTAIKEYLILNANDVSGKQRGFARRLAADQTPLRITELPGFKREHGNFRPATLKKAGTLSNCAACHTGAAKGIFGD